MSAIMHPDVTGVTAAENTGVCGTQAAYLASTMFLITMLESLITSSLNSLFSSRRVCKSEELEAFEARSGHF
jgi:hypothetical protein